MLFKKLFNQSKFSLLILPLLSACGSGSSSVIEPQPVPVPMPNHAPSSSSIANVNATEDQVFSELLIASDADGDALTFSKVSGASWLSVDGDTLVGTPSTEHIGSNSVVLDVTDGQDNTQTTLTITVNAAVIVNNAPSPATIVVYSAIESIEFSQTLLATDEDNDSLTFSKVSGASWLTVLNGQLVGIPSVDNIGSNSVIIEVSDGQDSTQGSLTITVVKADEELELNVNANVGTSDWTFNGSEDVSVVAAAQVSGDYAVGNNQLIEIRDVRQSLLNTITAADIQTVLPEINLSADDRICAMSLTSSGRLLYFGICTGGSGSDKGAIFAYNTNTKQLSIFDRLTISTDKSSVLNYGMTYFKGELFVGTQSGLFRYDASRNAVADNIADEPSGNLVITQSSVTGLTVDMITQKLYVSTEEGIYSSVIGSSLVLESVLSASNVKTLTFARAYGSSETAGLYFLQNDGEKSRLLMVKTDDLASGANTVIDYSEFNSDLIDISATADGKMLLAQSTAKLMRDVSDQRMDFDTWLKDELSQYVAAIKNLTVSGVISGTNTLTGIPEGFLTRKIVAANQSPSTSPIADNVGWAIYLLMAADQVTPDDDIELLIELLIQRHAGLHPDGLGGVKTVDGHFVRNYESSGIPSSNNAQPQVYISMKFIPAVYKAAKLYPDNANIQAYKEYLRQTMKRASDTIRAEQRITWTNDQHGPIETNNKMTNETWIYGDIGAAQDPLATQDYAEYVYSRTKMDYDYWLLNEPVIKASHSAFIVMGGSMILRHHFEDPNWNEQNRNYYAITRAASDDLGAPYFAAFSAGNSPERSGNYYNDGPSDHPGNLIHFPAVNGLGQLGWTSPVVGAYMAYRDGLRQEMLNSSDNANFSMLTRWSSQDSSYIMPSVGIADFWYGALGLVETIQPGVLNVLRDEFYLPELVEATSEDGNVELHYSTITPRRVIAIDAVGNEISFGFQLSPFEFKTGQVFSHYKVVDPEGELLELNDVVSEVARFVNGDFEQELIGWQQTANSSAISALSSSESIVGTSAEIHTDAHVAESESSLSQALDVSLDLEDTRYIIRANGTLLTSGDSGQASLRITWDSDDNIANGFISTTSSNVLDHNNRLVEFVRTSNKPNSANFMHISFVVETLTASEHRYLFDDLSVVRLGANSLITNGDFENDMADWNESASQISLITDADKVISGTSSLQFLLAQGITGWKKVTKEIDVLNDNEGTRYIFRLDTKVVTMLDSNFEIMIEVFDVNGIKTVTRNDVGDIIPSTEGEIAFTFRKRPDDASYLVTFRMKRNSSDSSGTDEIIIDNFRLDKERLF